MLAVQALRPCEEFLTRIACASNRVLLLDYDGTIAPFTIDRQRALPYAGVRDLLSCLVNTTNTRLVMVSGRPAVEVGALLDVCPMPEIWGSHGVEHLKSDGAYDRAYLQLKELMALCEAEEWLHHEGLDGRIEAKPGAVAVHWRGLSDGELRDAQTAALRALGPIARRDGLFLIQFDGGVELRVPSFSKASAVRTVLAQVTDDIPVAYLGDDIPDEDAFRALRPDDLSVLVRSDYRSTAAKVWLRPPAELKQFLADWILACGGQL